MAIDEGSRHRLFKRLEDVLGETEASTLMAHLPPTGWGDVATKQDLREFDLKIEAKLSALESRMLRSILISNSASILTVGGLAFAAAKLV